MNLPGRTQIDTDDIGLVKFVSATLAELNAGKTLLAGDSGAQYRVQHVTMLVTGSFTTLTSADVKGSTGTAIFSVAQANLGTGTQRTTTNGGGTNGAGLNAALAMGESVVLANVGSAAAGGTKLDFLITYNKILRP